LDFRLQFIPERGRLSLTNIVKNLETLHRQGGSSNPEAESIYFNALDKYILSDAENEFVADLSDDYARTAMESIRGNMVDFSQFFRKWALKAKNYRNKIN